MTTNTKFLRETCYHERMADQSACPLCRGDGWHFPELRILTLWQPWASLMAWGEKTVETRPARFPNYQGWVAIHAAQTIEGLNHCDIVHDSLFLRFLTEALNRHGHEPTRMNRLPRGKILAVLRFCERYPTENTGRLPEIAPWEAEFGNYEPGRVAILTDCLQPLRQPIEFSNGQGLRRATALQSAMIARELAA